MADSAEILRETDLGPDPVAQFEAWFAEVRRAGVAMPEAAAVATATSDGRPSVRMVLVKEVDHRGFVFFTNYESRKGAELSANPFAALMFYWSSLARQVRVEGPVQRVADEETVGYVRSRPRASRLSALASPQSTTIDSREVLEQRVAELAARYADTELPIAADWGGFRLAPETFEFWQERKDRLHDRLRYTRERYGGWRIDRLAP
ncbi:MAG: pyridoxamine 5'-phosphate oxidase [Solirubrobacteraceae bacterium]